MTDKAEKPNALYCGDNLEILRDHIPDASVDLIYLDPPFNSNQDYNVLFAEQDGSRAAAQIKAFGDTWRWDQGAAAAYADVVEQGGDVSRAMQAFRQLLGENNMLAYLAMMAPRLVELRRVLKPTGSLYLHCDPTASHYLKLILDAIFDPRNFRSELTWKRSSAHSDTRQGRKIHGHIHDVILFYTRSNSWTWNPVYTRYEQSYTDEFYRNVEPSTGRRFATDNLTAAKPGGDTEYEWKGVKPYNGRYWAYSKANMEQFEHDGRLYYAKSGMPRYKRYLDEMPGVPLQDVWTDIPPALGAQDLGYPTQKPTALLERIINASSNPGDVVLDPFCGCGTAIAAAQKLGRRWIGIDITHLAIGLMRHRLFDAYGEPITAAYTVHHEPKALPEAQALATQDKFEFQHWALGLVGARSTEVKKGADHGIDGRLYFHDVPGTGTKQIILSVKGGHTDVKDIRDLGHVVSREGAQIGVLITLQEPTKPMRTEVADGLYYDSPWGRHPRLQILTIAELLAGKQIDMPPIRQVNATYKRAPKAKPEPVEATAPLWPTVGRAKVQ